MTATAVVEAVVELHHGWRSDSSLQGELNTAFDRIGFTAEYVGKFAGSRSLGKSKAIKDNIWGMIEFTPEEMALIDSPLLQRMRYIRQLGFSYFTYPSAEHSRFTHSLGIAHVVERFIASITRERSAEAQIVSASVDGYVGLEALAPLTRFELLYAALLHDVGHLPFSHASEAALDTHGAAFRCGGIKLRDRLTQAREAVQREISLSELLSLLIVLSTRFAEFYHRIFPITDDDPQSLARIACLIAGAQAIPQCLNIQELISAAAVDADKIDYVARDARSCGISVGVDVSRIFLGSGVVRASRGALDERYDRSDKLLYFVVNSSGIDTLDEIVQARSALYQRVYLHPVTRAAEAMLAQALAEWVKQADGVSDAISLWSYYDQELLLDLCRSADQKTAKLGRALRDRRLPKKACPLAVLAATEQMPLRSVFRTLDEARARAIKKDVVNSLIEKLTRNRINEVGLSRLEQMITAEAVDLAARLRAANRYASPADGDPGVVIIPIATSDAGRPDALVFQNGEITSTPYITNVQGQQDAYDLFKAVGYVMANEAWRLIVMLAARTVVYRLSLQETVSAPIQRILFPNEPAVAFRTQTILSFDAVVRRVGLPRAKADELTAAAVQIGYFDNLPLLAKRTRDDDEAVVSAARKFSAFDGQQGWKVTRGSVAAFADQFPPRFRGELLVVLNEAQFLGQAETVGLLKPLLEARSAAAPERVIIAGLSPSSGGAIATSLKASLADDRVVFVGDLKAALKETGANDRIVLVDDNAASGVQSSAQLHAWLGINRESWPEALRKETGIVDYKLEDAEIDKLKATSLEIIVAVGLDRAHQRLVEDARRLGLLGFKGVAASSPIGANVSWSNELKNFLTEVGRELVSAREFGVPYRDLEESPRERVDYRAFGYGGVGALLATTSNVPTSTVTAFWHPGQFESRPWIPLLLRRGRFKDLVLG